MKEENWQAEMEFMKSLLDAITELTPTVKWGSDVYTFNGANVVSFGGFKHFFSIWFYNGVFLEDRMGVLVNASEGKSKSLRQWRFARVDEMDAAQIRAYVEEAIQIEKKGMKIAPKSFESEPLPTILQEKIGADRSLKEAFYNLSPGKQKEYALYIKEAKQDATKTTRLDKIIPLILAGKGLNDKYKK